MGKRLSSPIAVDSAATSQMKEDSPALAAALNMAQRDDLILFFCEAITRSWKQITKFTPEGAEPRSARTVELPSLAPAPSADEAAVAAMEGVIREERGLVFARHDEDSD